MILITGASGFVGRQVLGELLRNEHPIRILIRADSQPLRGLREIDQVVETSDIFRAERSWWMKTLDGIDRVIHLAWHAEPGKYLQSPLNLSCL